jgi:prolyl-tRNA editing enzyme YbaK/EbsC (Cys-tRNA(Pro) deacylase)
MRSITALPAIYNNGGRRGLLLRMKAADLMEVLKPSLVDVALED